MESTTSTAPRPPLQRARDDSLLLGVCAGIGRSLGVAPLWPRLGAIALCAVVPAVGLIAYAVLGVVVRRDDGRMALGGEPDDGRETGIGWGLVLVSGWLALTSPGAVTLGAPSPLLLVAAGAAAIVAAYAAGRGGAPAGDEAEGAGDGATLTLPATTEEPVTETLPPQAPAPAGKPGPSLLLIGVGALAVVALGTLLLNPVAAFSLGPVRAVTSGAWTLGLLALAGVVAAIVLNGRRHAGGLLALSLVVGAMAIGLGSVADEAGRVDGSEPVVQWVLQRGADLLRLDG